MYRDIKIQSISCLAEKIVQLFNCKWLNLIILSIFDTNTPSQVNQQLRTREVDLCMQSINNKIKFFMTILRNLGIFVVECVCVACENANLKITDRMDFVTLYSNFYLLEIKIFSFHR